MGFIDHKRCDQDLVPNGYFRRQRGSNAFSFAELTAFHLIESVLTKRRWHVGVSQPGVLPHRRREHG